MTPANPFLKTFRELTSPNLYPVTTSWEDTSVKEKIPFLERVNDKIFGLDSKVTKVNAGIGDTTSYILFYNSEGLIACDYRPLVYISVTCVMEKDGRIENFYVSRSARQGFEYLTNDLIDNLAKEAVEKTNIQFEAVMPKAGEMEVVMSAGESGILLHEAIGHAFEADVNRKKTSIFCDRLNKKVAENFVTIVDDGTLPLNRGSLNSTMKAIRLRIQ